MPIYEYICADCGNAFSHLHKRFNEPFPPCPQCGSSNVKKELSTFSTASSESASGCEHAGECAHAQAPSGHHCCNGCCHHH